MVTNSYGKRNFMEPKGKFNIYSFMMCLVFGVGGVGVGGNFFLSNYVTNVYPCHEPMLLW
jgi:hypothetical protein